MIPKRRAETKFLFVTNITEKYGATEEDKKMLSQKTIRLGNRLLKIFSAVLSKNITIDVYEWILPLEDKYGWVVDTHGIEFVMSYTLETPRGIDPNEREISMLAGMIAKRYKLELRFPNECLYTG